MGINGLKIIDTKVIRPLLRDLCTKNNVNKEVIIPLVKDLNNGKKILTAQHNGKTVTQVLDKDGKILNTRIKDIYKSQTRTSVKKTYIEGQNTNNPNAMTINDITWENGDVKQRLSIVEKGGFKTYNQVCPKCSIKDDGSTYLTESIYLQRLKSVSSNSEGIRNFAQYSKNYYGRQNSANIFPVRGGDGYPRDVNFNEKGKPILPELDFTGLEKYL